MKNYILVGAGGTGTFLLRPLYTYLRTQHANEDWMLFILDGDVVEEKNLERQAFPIGAVTMNKAEAAALILGDADHVKAYPEYLSEENIERFIQDGDTVLICVDNFTVRKHIESRCLRLDNVTVINGGNEKFDGSVQLWVREGGANITPRIGYGHPEIAIGEGDDRSEMTCAQAAALPGGTQTLIANAQSATWMLTALWRAHTDLHRSTEYTDGGDIGPRGWTELQFDAFNGTVVAIDQRISAYWRN